MSLSTRCTGSRTAGQRWTRRSYRNYSYAVTATHCSGSPRASGTSWRLWPKAAPTRGSPGSSW
jgi:hypothetical protein